MDNYKALFGNAINATTDEQALGALMAQMAAQNAGAEASLDMLKKHYLMRLIVAVATRLSLLASVWLFVLDADKWVGMPIFFILAIFVGGVQPLNMQTKATKPKVAQK
jgi:hypothetical protein